MCSVLELVGELRDVVDRLLASAAEGSGDPADVHAAMVALHAERDRLAVAAAEVVQQWTVSERWRCDGTLRAPWALARDTHSSDERARVEVRRASALQRMPLVRAAVLDGRLSIDHLDLLARYATPARWDVFVRDEALLVERCAELRTFDDARRMVRYWADLVDDLLDRPPASPRPSRLYASRHHDTGELLLAGALSAVDGEIVHDELRRLSTEIRVEDERAGVRRTAAQRRAAALVRMATRSVDATGISARPLFQVIVGDESARRLCELASGVVVHPAELVGRIDDAVMETFLFDGPSVVIAKTHRRTFTGALRRAIQVRDRRCQHPSGCRAPASECDVDHIHPAALGGATSQFNGRAECIPHNRIAHLHDPPPPHRDPPPERPLDRLDEIRARLRWRMLREHADEGSRDPCVHSGP